jgi:hypothetical protein
VRAAAIIALSQYENPYPLRICSAAFWHRHILNAKSTPGFDQAGGELMGNRVGATAPCRLHIELLQNLHGQRTRIFIQQSDGTLPLERFIRIPAYGIQQNVGIEEVEHYFDFDRVYKSSRESLSDALKAMMRLLISRSWRFRRSVSVSCEASCLR